MGLLVIGIVILILGAVFNKMMRVEPLPPQQNSDELDEEIGGWSRLEALKREIDNGGNREFVNSERGQNAPPVFRTYNTDSKIDNAESDSSEKVLTDFSPDTYVFGSALYESNFLDKSGEKPIIANAIAFNNLSSAHSIQESSDDVLMTNKKRRELAVNFNMKDAIIFSALLNPKFKEDNSCEREILI